MTKLDTAGYKTTKRSIQRDLNLLSGVFPLICDDRSQTFGWSWSGDAPTFDLPAMDGPTALTVRLIEQGQGDTGLANATPPASTPAAAILLACRRPNASSPDSLSKGLRIW